LLFNQRLSKLQILGEQIEELEEEKNKIKKKQ
jgi:hypothetical protein